MSPQMSAFVGVILTIAISYVKKESRFTAKKLFHAFADGAKGAVDVMISCAVVGFIVGSFTLSGLGVKMAFLVTALAHNNLFLTLLFSALASIILGMGVPTTANYIMMSMITVPAVTMMGVHPLAAHLFCFYFGIVSDLTPPVALAALCGAGIAKAKFWPTAFNATRIGIAAYIIPFFFVYNPVLLLGQLPFSFGTVQAVVMSVIGIIAISCGLFGYIVDEASMIERIIIIAAGVAMVHPGTITDVIGVVVIAAMIVLQFIRKKKRAAAAA